MTNTSEIFLIFEKNGLRNKRANAICNNSYEFYFEIEICEM